MALAVGRARRLQLEACRPPRAVQELVEQARLAHARIADDQRDGALAVGSPRWSPRALELRSRPTSGVNPRSRDTSSLVRPRISPLHGIGAHRLPLPLDLELAEILEDEEPGTSSLVRRLTTIWPGWATLRSRAARFIVSPTAV